MSLSTYLEEHIKSHSKQRGNIGEIIRSCASRHGYICDTHAPSREHVIYAENKRGEEVVIKGKTKEEEIIALKALQHHPYHVKLEDYIFLLIY